MQSETRKNSLDIGIEVSRYEIREVLGMGGFGITYKAWDPKFKRMVAVKEFLPMDTAGRASDSIKVQANESQLKDYQYGLKQFVNEAQTLAQLRHQNIVIAYDYIEANNTAYLVMEYVQGQTLAQHLKQQGGTLGESELLALLKPLLQGLQYIHQQEYYHRDIKPDNIYLRNQNEPVLIDFGAARQAVGTRSRSLTSIVSAGYAPPEQYGSNQKKLGPWSDLYSIGAMLYRCVSGRSPTDAPTRRNELADGDSDPLIAASTIAKQKYSESFLKLIDWMLEPVIRDRPQNVQEVLLQLEGKQQTTEARSTEPTALVEEARTTAPTKIVEKKRQEQLTSKKEKVSKHPSQVDEVEHSHKKPKRWLLKTTIVLIILFLIIFIAIKIFQPRKFLKRIKNNLLEQISQEIPKQNKQTDKPITTNNEVQIQQTKTLPEKNQKTTQEQLNQEKPVSTHQEIKPTIAETEAPLVTKELPEQSKTNINGITMIKINSGCFQMGSNEEHVSEKPVHEVCLSAYDLGQYEVTQGQWQKVMGNNPSFFKGNNNPVENVSWNDVQSFIAKLNQQTRENYRLPTEAEWEFACHNGGTSQKYCGSNDANSVAWYKQNSGRTTYPVGQKQPNGLGFYDMSGNVCEWVQDRYSSDYYSKSPSNNPTGPTENSDRVYRGGSWRGSTSGLRSAVRGYFSPDFRGNILGFRLARTR